MNKVGLIEVAGSSLVIRQILSRGNSDLMVWSPEDGSVDTTDKARQVPLEELATASLLVFTAPLDQCRPLARALGDVITGRHVIVHTIRGIEPGTAKIVSEILQEETPTQRFGFITGPMSADDHQSERPGAIVCASLFPEVHDLVEEAMVAPNFRVYRSQDMVGAEVSAAYARIIALMSGLGRGLDLGDSLQALLSARGLAEAARFVVFRQGFERTTFGLSGLGNLHLDTSGKGSLDFQIGQFLAKKKKLDPDTVLQQFGHEARPLLDMIQAFFQIGSRASLDLPLLSGVHAILHQSLAPKEVISSLMNLPALYE